jgi:hypothetical protein
MTREQLNDTIGQALRDAVGPAVVDHADVAEGRDHDGDPALFVTVYYRAGTEMVDQTAALSTVRDRLLAFGEERFPYMHHVYPDDQYAEDDEAPGGRAAS